MMSSRSVLVVIYAACVCQAYRLVEETNDDDQACRQEMDDVVERFTYRDLFSTVIDGTFKIRNRNTGKYLMADENGLIGLTLAAPFDGDTYWDITSIKMSSTAMRRYWFVNRGKALTTMVDADSVEMDSKKPSFDQGWSFKLLDDGVHYQIVHESSSKVLVAVGDEVALSDSGSEVFMDHWYLECTHRSIYWSFLTTRFKRRAHQWGYFANMPMIRGGLYSWKQFMGAYRMNGPHMYAVTHSEFVKMGMLVEDNRNTIRESHVNDICAMTIMGLKQFTRHPGLLEDVHRHSPSCPSELERLSSHLRSSVVEKCFSGALQLMETHAQDSSCSADFNSTEWFMGLLNGDDVESEQFGSIPTSTLEDLAEYTMQRHCHVLKPSELLWAFEDKTPRTISAQTVEPVCSVKDGKMSRSGACPSGTVCGCPSSWLKKHASTTEIRDRGASSVYVSPGVAGYVVSYGLLFGVSNTYARLIGQQLQGTILNPVAIHRKSHHGAYVVSSSPGLVSYVRNLPSVIVRMALGIVVRTGFLVPFTTAALIFAKSPFFLGRVGLQVVQFVLRGLRFKCEDAVGCWPSYPEKVYTKAGFWACRAQETAREGGAVDWFMPPPGMRFSWLGRGLFAKCSLTRCSVEDQRLQRIGFGRKGEKDEGNVYNCQPHNVESMDANQKSYYLKQSEGPEEYATDMQKARNQL